MSTIKRAFSFGRKGSSKSNAAPPPPPAPEPQPAAEPAEPKQGVASTIRRSLSFGKKKGSSKPDVYSAEPSAPEEPAAQPAQKSSLTAALPIGRSLSFKRKVKSGQITTPRSPSKENGESKILIAGEVGLSHGSGVKNWQFGHAVAYAGASGGLAIALHKRETDFTSFRAFPIDVTYLTRQREVEELPSVDGERLNLRIEGDTKMQQPPLVLSFGSQRERAEWLRALLPVGGEASSSATTAAKKEMSAEDRAVAGAMKRLRVAKSNAAADRKRKESVKLEIKRIEQEYERMVKELEDPIEELYSSRALFAPPEDDGVGAPTMQAL